MSSVTAKNILSASLCCALLAFGSAQAATNPFAEARADSRLPLIAQDASEKCSGMGNAADEKAASMPCGQGKCGAGMTDSAKPDAEPMQGDKCGGGSGAAMPAGQCGGGK